jgi:osmotically-inducible protein OsmY
MRSVLWALSSATVLAFGCAHQEQAPGASQGFMEQAKDDFVSAYDSVKSGVTKTATAGKYALEDAGQGVVRVTDRSKAEAGKAGGAIEDSWITTKIKTAYTTDPMVKSGDVHVNTDSGIVKLSGTVNGPREAERAIDTALATKGVVAVDSNLQFSGGGPAPSGVYTAPDEVPPPPPSR